QPLRTLSSPRPRRRSKRPAPSVTRRLPSRAPAWSSGLARQSWQRLLLACGWRSRRPGVANPVADPQQFKFCPRCGHEMTRAYAYGKERSLCEACGFIHCRDPKVAAVVFVTDGERVLLVQRAVNPQRGKWSLPAGYIDYGEDPREAAVREVEEETGLRVSISRLIDVLGPDSRAEGPASIVILFEGI